MKQISLLDGRHVLVDDLDWKRVAQLFTGERNSVMVFDRLTKTRVVVTSDRISGFSDVSDR